MMNAQGMEMDGSGYRFPSPSMGRAPPSAGGGPGAWGGSGTSGSLLGGGFGSFPGAGITTLLRMWDLI